MSAQNTSQSKSCQLIWLTRPAFKFIVFYVNLCTLVLHTLSSTRLGLNFGIPPRTHTQNRCHLFLIYFPFSPWVPSENRAKEDLFPWLTWTRARLLISRPRLISIVNFISARRALARFDFNARTKEEVSSSFSRSLFLSFLITGC